MTVATLGTTACDAGLGGDESGLGSAAAERVRTGQVFRDCDVCPEMVVVPPGSYMMGSPASEEGRYDREGPQHPVTIGYAFALGVYEVTFAEWDACAAAGGCEGDGPYDWGWGRGRRPVISVSWEDAQEYLWWLSRETGVEYRLPSESEWEYAARAGTATARHWGESESEQCRYANGYDRRSASVDLVSGFAECDDGYPVTAPVGVYEANTFGLHDMLGNASELTEDCWNENYSGAPSNGSAWLSGDCSQRVSRGGHSGAHPHILRSANRSWYGGMHDGFRVARTLSRRNRRPHGAIGRADERSGVVMMSAGTRVPLAPRRRGRGADRRSQARAENADSGLRRPRTQKEVKPMRSARSGSTRRAGERRRREDRIARESLMSIVSGRLAWGALLGLVIVASACAVFEGRDDGPPDAPPDARWESIISARSFGMLSNRDNIRIVFANDVASDQWVGRSTSGVMALAPETDGSAIFVGPRELVFTPTDALRAGETYRVTLAGEGLLGIPDDIGDYWFEFEVIAQELELEVDGLENGDFGDDSGSYPNDGECDDGRFTGQGMGATSQVRRDASDCRTLLNAGRITWRTEPQVDAAGEDLVLSGALLTADFADPEAVENILDARQRGTELAIRWQHSDDGLEHRFQVDGVTRGETDEVVLLRWDGTAIGAASRGRLQVPVPARDVFGVTSVRAESDDRQFVVARFSDPLDPNQNLNGLIGLGGVGFTVETAGSTLRLFPSERVVGIVEVALEAGIRSRDGKRLEERSETEVSFTNVKPGVRFAGRGVILPRAGRLTVPVEVLDAHSLQLTALQVFESNIGQFLQRNDLSGSDELQRTGRTLWRRMIDLPFAPGSGWTRYNLDVSDVVRADAGSLFHLTLSINRGNAMAACTDEENRVPVVPESPPANREDADGGFTSLGDGSEASYQNSVRWIDRNDPCTDSYYRHADRVNDSRNFLASNIGITAKRDPRGGVLVATTDLETSEPMPGVSVTFMNYQDQPLETVLTGSDGLARATLEATPFYAVASRGGEQGYLKMSPGLALPTSHFDVGGSVIAEGLKGVIYGERDIWRPGDPIHLTFVLDDTENPLPDGHPATMRLSDPMGQVVHSVTNTEPLNGFYAFPLHTAEDAPTGNWNAAVEVGGARFSAPVKVETVIPNRLRVDLDLGGEELLQGGVRYEATLDGQWLSGAVARGLDADVRVSFAPTRTAFNRFTDHVFDDPARDFSGEPLTIFEESLDDAGHAVFDAELVPGGESPGMLTATFTTRVFEEGGAFSTNRRSVRFSPYDRYVGVRLPPGDAVRGMLLTDTIHTVDVVTLSGEGEPVSADSVDLTLYKIDWRWWWDRSAESLARYTDSEHSSVVASGRITTSGGRGSWDFTVSDPDWGRYLLRACDAEGGHCTGRAVYIDWPGWAGRPREGSAAGANALTLVADRTSYTVGDVAEIQLPEASVGRALVTIETGARILDARWLDMTGGRVRVDVPVTSEMSPNAYVGVSVIQPHSTRDNDRPIRLYGVIPLEVEDPGTVLRPEIDVPEEWLPSSTATIGVAEASGRPMTYTLAVVDEGLLGLTSFRTPDLHDHFYSREALGVSTWDVFDEVAGAYGAELERLLALGGDDAADLRDEERSRFPPVVRFMGPFTLEPSQRRTHQVDIPQYIGQVRVMVVAGHEGAYGSSSESVFVRQPLSMLATVPRVVGPGEEFTVPVSLFAMEDGIEEAVVTLDADAQFEVVGSGRDTVAFDGADERMARLEIRAGDRPGQGGLRFTAASGRHTAQSEIALDVRSPNPVTANQLLARIAPGERWSTEVVPLGIPWTNSATLEVTSLPPLNLEGRLGYLVRYPHGCIEQTVSSVLPQLYLPSLVQFDDSTRARIEENVEAGIERLRLFRTSSGGFSYWPGGNSVGRDRDGWGTSYAGHFLLEAEHRGYFVDPDMLADWKAHQRRRARAWRNRSDTPAMDQAYRLYTLALANEFEMGAMNRLRESGALDPAAAWHLAAAYGLAGVEDAALRLLGSADEAPQYPAAGWSMGSALRDHGILLDALVTLGSRGRADGIAEGISDELYSDTPHGTHSLAYALFAMARYYGLDEAAGELTFDLGVEGDVRTVASSTPVHSENLAAIAESGGRLEVTNTSNSPLFASLVTWGSPAAGDEDAASSGLEVEVEYTDMDGARIDVGELPQGTDLVATVTIRNESGRDARDLALEYRAPSGWEIHNARLDAAEASGDSRIDYQDVRDDRVLTYFSLDDEDSISLSMQFNAAYLGRYYLPTVSAEAMYDASVHGRIGGRWVRVVEQR